LHHQVKPNLFDAWYNLKIFRLHKKGNLTRRRRRGSRRRAETRRRRGEGKQGGAAWNNSPWWRYTLSECFCYFTLH